MTGAQNIEAVYEQADKVDRREGFFAYYRYHHLMQDFANYYHCPLNNTVAAFVSLSPNNSWWNNLRSLATVLNAISRGALPEDFTTSTYNACKIRAYNYATGAADFMLNTRGPKVRAFFANIMEPANTKPVTIDGHMMSVWLGKQMTMMEASQSKCDYAAVARQVRRCAKAHGLIANQLQATLWFTWKRTHNIVYDGQLNLFRQDAQWGIMHRPEDVRPFEKRAEVLMDRPLPALATNQLSLLQ